jgi:hypothetical protein
MEDIEHIFPDRPPIVAEPTPVEGNGLQARSIIADYRRSLHHTEERLQKELVEAHRRGILFDELYEHVRQNWPLHIMDWFSRNKELVGDIDRTIKSRLPGAMQRTLGDASVAADELKSRYTICMDTTAAKLKFKPDANSRHPMYHFQDGFFTVTISEPSYVARIEDLAGPLCDRMPADPAAIITYLRQEKVRLFGRPFAAEAFLRRLLNSYLAIVERDPELKDGEPVPIRRIMSRLHDNEKAFRNDEFLVDLTRFLDASVSSVDGRKLILEQTRDSERGLYVFPRHGAGYIGFVHFTNGA